MRLFSKKEESEEIKKIEEYINENIATSRRTQRNFSYLLLFNGCRTIKVGHIGNKIRKKLLKEAKNNELHYDEIMNRTYELIGEFLKTDNVKTFEDLEKANQNQELINQQEKEEELLKKTKELEKKFNIDLTSKEWFKCSIEERKYSTFTNKDNRNIDTAYVIINEDNFEIIKESVWIKSKMGTRKIFFQNITSIDFDARGKFHISSSVIINTKSAEHIQLKFVTEDKFKLMNDAFEAYMTNSYVSVTSSADELLKYAELFEKGLLTEEEFKEIKNKLLN